MVWSARIPEGAQAPAGISPDGGALYFSTDRGLVALDSKAGARLWNVPGALSRYATPLVDSDGTVYTVGGYGHAGLRAYTSTGKQKWSHPEMGTFQSPPVLTPAGELVAGNYQGEIWRLTRDGEILWSGSVPGHVNGEFGIGPGGEVYAVEDPGKLHAFGPDGERTWGPLEEYQDQVHIGTGVVATPEGPVLTTGWSSNVHCRDPRTGQSLWEYSAALGRRRQPGDESGWGNTLLSSTPALSPDGKTIYVAGMGGLLTALDRDGNKLWAVETGLEVPHSGVQVVEDGTIYVGGERPGGVNAYNPDGELLWSYHTKDPNANAAISVRGNLVYLATSQGEVHALSADALAHRAELQGAGKEEPVPRIEVGEGYVVIGSVRLPRRRG
ncbi:MAG: PQQ-like beta-propeller repeat protein [Armatimonadetes bacterium]|nr:PQQ-like beta-propeller repeat protein [Armatimonadota bacterium]